jgi:hypothetical protein
MATTGDSKFYPLPDGSGRIEASTHPDYGYRVFACSACGAVGAGEGNFHWGEHKQGTTPTGGNLPADHFN